jgi:hypothetical protein
MSRSGLTVWLHLCDANAFASIGCGRTLSKEGTDRQIEQGGFSNEFTLARVVINDAGLSTEVRRIAIGISDQIAAPELPALLQKLSAFDPGEFSNIFRFFRLKSALKMNKLQLAYL